MVVFCGCCFQGFVVWSPPLLSLSSSKVDPYCTRLLAFKVPLVALPDAPPSWNSRFSPSLVPPPPPTPFQSPRSPLAALGLLEFYRARYPRCRLRFILQLSLIQRIPWSVIITPGHFRLLLFSTRFSFVCTFVGCGRGNWKPGFWNWLFFPRKSWPVL